MKAAIAVAAMVVLAGVALLTGRATLWSGAHDLLLTDVTAAAIEGQPGTVGVFLKIVNDGPADRLLGASSPQAGAAMLGDAPPEGLAIPAGAAPVLAPDGAFVRLEQVTGPLDDGRTLPVTLEFAGAGRLNLRARLADPRAAGPASGYGLFGIGDICRVGPGEPAPELSLSAKADGDGWIVEVAARGFTFTPDLADGPHIPGTGHGHLYLGGLKLQRLYEPMARIGALPPGRHELRVTLNTNDHRAYVVDDVPVTASTVIEVR